jgi:hypothetical protein
MERLHTGHPYGQRRGRRVTIYGSFVVGFLFRTNGGSL